MDEHPPHPPHSAATPGTSVESNGTASGAPSEHHGNAPASGDVERPAGMETDREPQPDPWGAAAPLHDAPLSQCASDPPPPAPPAECYTPVSQVLVGPPRAAWEGSAPAQAPKDMRVPYPPPPPPPIRQARILPAMNASAPINDFFQLRNTLMSPPVKPRNPRTKYRWCRILCPHAHCKTQHHTVAMMCAHLCGTEGSFTGRQDRCYCRLLERHQGPMIKRIQKMIRKVAVPQKMYSMNWVTYNFMRTRHGSVLGTL